MERWEIRRYKHIGEWLFLQESMLEGWEPFAITAAYDDELVWLRKKIEEPEEKTLEEIVSEVRDKQTGKQGRGTGKAAGSKE